MPPTERRLLNRRFTWRAAFSRVQVRCILFPNLQYHAEFAEESTGFSIRRKLKGDKANAIQMDI